MFRIGLVLLCTLVACSSGRTDDRELGGLVVAPDETVKPIDLARAVREPAELGRALALPAHDVARALGPHVTTIKSVTVVHEGANQVDALTTDITIELGADGAWHATLNNSEDYGRETIWSGGALYLRQRYARWHKRAPNDEHEPAALHDAFGAELAAVWDLLAPGVELSDRGARTVAGRGGRVIEVKLSPSPKKAPSEPLAQRKWRETRVVEAASGEVVLDTDTGAPLAIKLAGTVAFVRDGRAFKLTIDASHAVRDLGQAVAIALPPPEETVATPERLKEVDDRDALLKNLAPPIKAQLDDDPGAGSGSGSAGSAGSAGSGTGSAAAPGPGKAP